MVLSMLLSDEELLKSFGICPCNLRFAKEIRKELISIREQCKSNKWEFTDSQRLTIALLDVAGALTHGVNIEYPILLFEDEFWNKLGEEGQ